MSPEIYLVGSADSGRDSSDSRINSTVFGLGSKKQIRTATGHSNAARGKRKKADVDDKIPCILEPELTDKTFRKNWARLIQKIYEVDPLTCPECQGQMRVIAFIHDLELSLLDILNDI